MGIQPVSYGCGRTDILERKCVVTDQELLARIDERTSNIYTLVEKQERHLAELNGKVSINAERLSILEARCDERHSPPGKAKTTGVISLMLSMIGGLVYAIAKLMGK